MAQNSPSFIVRRRLKADCGHEPAVVSTVTGKASGAFSACKMKTLWLLNGNANWPAFLEWIGKRFVCA